MPRALTIVLLLTAGLALAAPAWAESAHEANATSEPNCWVPITVWKPRSAVEALAKVHGWTMRRVLVDDGCYEMLGSDKKGAPIEVRLHPKTLRILTVRRLDGSGGGADGGSDGGGD